MSRPVVPFPGRILVVVDPTSEDLTASLGTEVSPVPKALKPRRASEPQIPPTPAREPRELTEQEEDLQRRMFKAYFENRRPSRNHAQTSIANDRRAVEDLLAFIGQPLWQLTENDFEVWSAHLGVTRKLAPKPAPHARRGVYVHALPGAPPGVPKPGAALRRAPAGNRP